MSRPPCGLRRLEGHPPSMKVHPCGLRKLEGLPPGTRVSYSSEECPADPCGLRREEGLPRGFMITAIPPNEVSPTDSAGLPATVRILFATGRGPCILCRDKRQCAHIKLFCRLQLVRSRALIYPYPQLIRFEGKHGASGVRSRILAWHCLQFNFWLQKDSEL